MGCGPQEAGRFGWGRYVSIRLWFGYHLDPGSARHWVCCDGVIPLNPPVIGLC